MSLPNELHPLQLGAGSAAAYEIEQSLRFNNGDSAHLHRTPSSAGSQTTFTLSVWVKSSVPSSGSEYFYATHNGSRWNGILRRSGNYDFGVDESGGSAPKVVTNAKLRDPSAWYHLVMAYDTTQATSTDRVKIWINGALQSINTGAGSYPNLNHGSTFNRATKHWIGALDDTASVYYTKDFYLAEYHLLDGTAVTDADDFGEYDESGVWRPIEYEGGNYGTTGFYLKFDPSATNGIGHDHSGNGNDWTDYGFTTTGTGTDVMSDTPTTNYATLNPLGGNASSYSEGNLRFVGDTANISARGAISSFAVSSGKWYWEVTLNTASGSTLVGVVDSLALASTSNQNIDLYYLDNSYGYGSYEGNKREGTGSGASNDSYGNSYTNNDIIGVALDLDNEALYFSKNGTWQNSGVPTSGSSKTGAAFTTLDTVSGFFVAYACGAQSASGTFNFGQRDFEYTPPTGFKALNTANLPAPDIADGSDYFNTLLYTGTGGTKAVSGAGFQPEFVWIKNRSRASSSHVLVDAVRGATKALSSNLTNSEVTTNGTDDFRSFDSDGFTVGDSSNYFVNSVGDTHAAWCWDAGGSGSSNTDGSITSTVSANPTAGFSIVTYTGNSTDNATVGHGLGVKPDFVIIKNRSTSPTYPFVWHKSFGGEEIIWLSETNAKQTPATRYIRFGNNTATVFSLGTNNEANAGDDYIAYCFAEVEGYSKFGSYTGNGSSDGPFVHTGFAVRWLMWKKSSSTSNWVIWDTERHPYNVADSVLFPNSSSAEETNAAYNYDLLSNGFKVRTGSATINDNGATYIFAAFAEHPTGGSGVSPATAR